MSAEARHRRYDSATIAEARRLHIEGGWSGYKITQILNRRGIPVRDNTVYRWIDQKYDERRRLGNRERMRGVKAVAKQERVKSGPWFHVNSSTKYRMARMAALDGLGLSPQTIADVLLLDFATELTRSEVSQALMTGRPPRKWRTREET